MSRSRFAGPGNAATGRFESAPPGRLLPDHSDYEAGRPRSGLIRVLAGAGIYVLMLLLGVVAKLGPVARLDLKADQHIAAHDRTAALTTVAKTVSVIGEPATFGTALMIVIPVILLVVRRRLDAAKAFCMIAAAFALGEIGKMLINEHRPPVSLRAMATDTSPSFPSGHATATAIVAVALVVVASTFAGRVTALVLGGLYAVAVAASRVYLGDHYPLDVVGGMLCALAAGFVVTGLFALPFVQPYLRRFRIG
jgi:membrane-associated phospholipid phosphatase